MCQVIRRLNVSFLEYIYATSPNSVEGEEGSLDVCASLYRYCDRLSFRAVRLFAMNVRTHYPNDAPEADVEPHPFSLAFLAKPDEEESAAPPESED